MFSSKAFTPCVFASIALAVAAIAALAGPAPCLADSGEYYQGPPAPLVWGTPPRARTSSDVMMAVNPIKRDAPVEYLFDCVAGDGHDSKWQESNVYADWDLKPDTKYTYVAKVRDKASHKPLAPDTEPFEVLTRGDGKADTVGHVAKIDKALIAGKIELIPLMITGPSRNRINIVAINRWTPGSQNAYNKPELREEFIKDARHVLKAFDAADEAAIEPYPQYKDFFNVWAVWWPDWAIEQLDGVRGGSRHRCYPGGGSQTGPSAGGDAAWYLFGVGQPARVLSPKYVGPATTLYRSAPIVTDLLLAAGRGTYAYISRRPGLGTTKYEGKAKAAKPADAYDGTIFVPEGGNLLRYTYCTPDFVMGTSMVPALPLADWTLISCQNRWEGVIFAGNRTARIFVQPEAADGKHYYNASWSLQNKGVMIVQRLKTSRKAKGQRVWFDATLKRQERGGWVFAEAPQAYAAVRVVNGGSRWESDEVKGKRKGKPGNGMWLKCEDDFSPVILEVARKGDYPTFAAFQEAILANPMSWENKVPDYQSSLYKTKLTFHADYSKAPAIDGVPVNYGPKMAYDSPFIQGEFGSGVVTIQKFKRANARWFSISTL